MMDITDLRAQAIKTIEIPGFEPGKTIKVRVQKPRILALASRGEIPNPLMEVATAMTSGKGVRKDGQEPDLADLAKVTELFCLACLVEPTYEDMREFITDDQMFAIFNWGIGDTASLASFRGEETDGASNNLGEGVQ